MVPFDYTAKIPWEAFGMPAEPRPALLALRHAAMFRVPGVWIDSMVSPRSLMLIREADGASLEIFGAGRPEGAVAWLLKRRQGRPFTLSAPEPWFTEVIKILGKGQAGTVETWLNSSPADDARPPNPRVLVRALKPTDSKAFTAIAPSWALRGWRTFDALLKRGGAFGVPKADNKGFASVAWVFDRADPFASIGVFTEERYRNLGLGLASASQVITHLRDDLDLTPLWSADVNHPASLSLAIALGFQPGVEESILRWPPTA